LGHPHPPLKHWPNYNFFSELTKAAAAIDTFYFILLLAAWCG
jgi:hypothetical protein